MALYEFAATVRRAIIYAALGITALIVLWGLYSLGKSLYLKLNPPPEPPPTVGFGRLPLLRLPNLAVEGEPLYTLDTPTGALPEFDDRMEIVALAALQPTLLGEEKARTLARALDFGGEGVLSADKKILTFRDETDRRTLAVDVTTQNFELDTDLSRIRQLPKGSALSGPEAIKEAQSILSRIGRLKFGFDKGNQTIVFRAAAASAAEAVGSLSEAHLTEVNFFRSLTEVGSQNYPLLPAVPQQGLIRVWVTAGLRPEINNILKISYQAEETDLDKTRVETYPLRDVAESWAEIQDRRGIASLNTRERVASVQITKVGLAYFEDQNYQGYLQPIYVFSGVAKTAGNREVEFIAYSQAVSKDWIEE